MKKVFLTGSESFLGKYVIKELKKRSYEVIIPPAPKKPATLSQNTRQLKRCMKGCHFVIQIPENTITIAARSELLPNISLHQTQHLIEVALQIGIERFIHINTAHIFEPGTTEKPSNESSNFRKVFSKNDPLDSLQANYQKVTSAIKAKKLPGTILCPTFMLGAFERKPIYNAIVSAIYSGQLNYYSNGGRNYIYTQDVATGIVNALTQGQIGHTYILGHQNWDYKKIFNCIAQTIGVEPPQKFIPGWVARWLSFLDFAAAYILWKDPLLFFPKDTVAYQTFYYSSEKALKELYLPQTPIEVAIEVCFQWQKENNLLPKHLFYAS